jgi:hypothetical protein
MLLGAREVLIPQARTRISVLVVTGGGVPGSVDDGVAPGRVPAPLL